MPSAASANGPAAVDAVVRRYGRMQGVLKVSVAAVSVVAVLAAFAALPYLVALCLSLGALVLLSVPLFTTAGTIRLRTEADLETVRRDFAGERPPILPFHWGLADAVRSTDGGTDYEIPYLFGLRSVTITVETRTVSDDPDADLEIEVREADRPWGTYSVALEERDDATHATVEVESDRRFPLNRLPQTIATARYQQMAYEAQGYVVVEYDRSIGPFS
ncbi:hypothetical protein [Halopiger xanaduensis]|uniref:Uncharacterized protein n=1 Tax=Halopiger xanaduensis (strain DSM 18323 / JCM 14033 / SH-6) TaxID=797210 RepID=F8DBS1_HALXS|nr:hypothetical protein [Halopiger xanaduensis]AEH38624.1 hypothetical protein Halxa_4019 [Halopiger xanaduensis SH-6]